MSKTICQIFHLLLTLAHVVDHIEGVTVFCHTFGFYDSPRNNSINHATYCLSSILVAAVLGEALLVELAKQAAAAFPEAEIEIIEKHHRNKLDAPSGTALLLANVMAPKLLKK